MSFYAQLQPFGNTHARAVEQPGQDQVLPRQPIEDARQLLFRQDQRPAPLDAWAAHLAQPGQIDLQRLGIEKDQRRQRLSVRGCGHRAFGRQPAEKAFDLGPAHLRGVAYAVKAHERAYPVHVGLFGAAAVVQQANAFAHLVEQPGRLQCREALRRRPGPHSGAACGKRHTHKGLPVAAAPSLLAALLSAGHISSPQGGAAFAGRIVLYEITVNRRHRQPPCGLWLGQQADVRETGGGVMRQPCLPITKLDRTCARSL